MAANDQGKDNALLPGATKGEPHPVLKAATWNDLVSILESLTKMTTTAGGKLHFSKGKSVLDCGTGGSVSAEPHPFKLINVSVVGSRNIRVVYGTVNSLPPDGMSLGDSPRFVLDDLDESGVIFLKLTVDEDGTVDSREIDSAASLPADTDDTFHQEIGSWSVDGGGVLHLAQAISGSQAFELCGGVEPLWGLY